VHKLFGVPATALDGELARRRVSASGPAGLLRKALRRGEQGNVFWYPRRGYGQITDALADAGVDAGARIECDTTVTAVTVASDGVQVHATSPQGSRAFTASAVWSTVPVPVLSALTEGPAPRVRHRAMVLLYLVLPQVRWTEFDAHYLPGPEVPATRISEPRNYRDSADDPPDRTVLCVEWPCAVDDDVWTASPDALVARLRRAMAPQDLVIPEPIAVEVRRIAHAYPVYDLGFAERLAPTLAHLDAQLPRVVTFGRNGLFAHDNAHHALATAYAAVRCLANRDVIDVAAWRRELAGFARHVVED
jgi:protoporphyrinogen oxidase